MKNYQLALHIFRRDLRVADNTALIEALAAAKNVLPCFIFDTRQIENNDYKSDHCIQFMLHSLEDLQQQLQKRKGKLYFYHGIAEEIIKQLIEKHKPQAIYINRDYTPFSRKRDQQIAKICKKHDVDFHCYTDALLHEPEEVQKHDGQPYTVFTPFFNKAFLLPVTAPRKNQHDNYFHGTCSLQDTALFPKLIKKHHANLLINGGRQEAISLIKHIPDLANYADIRNFPAVNGTTKLSAHNKFGTISIRELYAAITHHFGKHHTLIKELYWRDFFTHIAFHYPHVFGHAFQKKYDALKWNNNENHFRAWCEGRTGFPIVDAGMRELNQTGYMHNRVRMITASFLVKDLHIDWRWGEKYFAQKLIDYDPCVNNGNWQWAASTGCDAQPYFRIFNPWLQQEKFDADALYIKRFIPELARVPVKVIHSLSKDNTERMTNYPKPIVSHAVESRKAIAMYKIK